MFGPASLDWLARLLAGLDCSFVVRRPAELRDALELRAEKIVTLAKRTDGEALLDFGGFD